MARKRTARSLERRFKILVRELAQVLIEGGVTVDSALHEFHRELLLAALDETGGNQVETARQQGMPRNTLRNQMIAAGLLSAPAATDPAAAAPSPVAGSSLFEDDTWPTAKS